MVSKDLLSLQMWVPAGTVPEPWWQLKHLNSRVGVVGAKAGEPSWPAVEATSYRRRSGSEQAL